MGPTPRTDAKIYSLTLQSIISTNVKRSTNATMDGDSMHYNNNNQITYIQEFNKSNIFTNNNLSSSDKSIQRRQECKGFGIKRQGESKNYGNIKGE